MTEGLLSIGLTTLDILARPVDTLPPNDTTALVERILLVPAGTAGGTALIAAKLGVKVRLASSVGADAAGRLVRAELAAAGIDVALLAQAADLPTSTTILPIQTSGQRPNLHAMGAGRHVEDTDALRQAASQARFVHYAAIGASGMTSAAAAQMLRAAKAAGATVTCDLISPRKSAIDELRQVLPFVDFFMPNAAEARFLSGREDLADAGRALRELGAGACVFTDGPDGSLLVDADGVHRIAAHKITPVDTTSCGDSYCAGFIAALEQGWSTVDACRLASAVSALVAQGLGTLGALSGFDAAVALMRAGMDAEINR